MNNRRTFLKQSSILSAALFVNPSELLKKRKHIGIQLYTLRELAFKDVKPVFAGIAAAGYKEVEMFGLDDKGKFFGLTPSEVKGLLKANGLKSPSGHYIPAKFLFENGNGDDVKNVCDAANILGHKYFIVPWLSPEQRSNIEQYKVLAERLNKAGEICKQNGLQLAYHNHDFEFDNFNGTTGYDILMSNTDKDLLKFELDLYWVVKAGLNPVDLFKKQPGRFHLWHVKDMLKTDRTKNTEVGNGSIDFKAIFAAGKLSGIKHFIVEQENTYEPDFYGSVTKSCDYVKKNLMR
jgi:sugar phosphate isomerase/epimerase